MRPSPLPFLAATLLAVMLLPLPGLGQVSPPPPGGVVLGDSVRIARPGHATVDARVTAWRADTLVMSVVGLTSPWELSAREIGTLHRYQTLSRRAGFRRGAGVGLAAGLFVGAAVGLALYATGVTNDPEGPPAEQLMHSVLKAAGLGTVAGAVTGGILGGRRPGWGWVSVRLVAH